jgi:hypothetical protein
MIEWMDGWVDGWMAIPIIPLLGIGMDAFLPLF